MIAAIPVQPGTHSIRLLSVYELASLREKTSGAAARQVDVYLVRAVRWPETSDNLDNGNFQIQLSEAASTPERSG